MSGRKKCCLEKLLENAEKALKFVVYMRDKALSQLRWITIPPIRFDGFYDDILDSIIYFLPTNIFHNLI